jgi:alanyl-tRNA synthetase
VIIKSEEEKFFQVNEDVRTDLENLSAELKAGRKATIPGDRIFYFHDTRGLPIDLIREFASGEGLDLDLDGYERLMEEQRRKSRGATKLTGEVFAETLTAAVLGTGTRSEFIGYEKLESASSVIALIKDNKAVDHVKGPSDFAAVLDITPFYGETGGQTGDKGVLEGKGFKIDVLDTKLVEKVPVHICSIKEGQVNAGDKVKAVVDSGRRMAIARHHTATHLLQAALRKVLGQHVHQSGSLVAPERLRFDFTHFKPMSAEEIAAAESLVNGYIRDNAGLSVQVMGIEEAKKTGATALFGEKYDKNVRVVDVKGISKEFCGGTHLKATGEIGIFKITAEESVAAGIRRIEAVAGEAAYDKIRESEKILKEVADSLMVKPGDLPAQIDNLLNRVADLDKKLRAYQAESLKEKAKELVSGKELSDNGIAIVARRLDGYAPDTLVNLTDVVKRSLNTGLVSMLAGAYEGKAFIVVGATDDLAKSGVDSRAIIKVMSSVIRGGGGGRPDLAQAGGKDISKLDEALKAGMIAVKEIKK